MSKANDIAYSPLNVDRLENARRGTTIGHKIVVFKSTGSTNDIAWEYAGNAANHGLCVLAESQTSGRGRRGHKWHSRPGESILCSVLLLKPTQEAEVLTLAAAVAAAEVIQSLLQLRCRIKWPNDLLVSDKKLAGILVEQKTLRRENRFVIGIGINCSQDPESFRDAALNLPATSLHIETGLVIDRTELACSLLERLAECLDRPAKKIVERWLELSGMLGRRVCIECDGKVFKGTCRGVDPVSGLILQVDRGPVQFFPANQTSLVGTLEL